MNVQEKIGNGGRALLVTAAFFAVAFGLKYTQEVTLPLLMAVFLAIASYPVVSGLRKWLKFPHWLAVTCAVVVDIALIYALVYLMKYMFMEIRNTMPDTPGEGTPGGNIVEQFIYSKAPGYVGEVLVPRVQTCIGKVFAVSAPGYVGEVLVSWVQTCIGKVFAVLFSMTGRLLAFMSYATLVLILMTFFLGEAPLFRRNLKNLAKRYPVSEQVLTVLSGVQKYIIIKTLASVCTGLLAWGLCSVMNVPLPFLWGVVACALNFIPTIGSIVAAIPPVALALASYDWRSGLVSYDWRSGLVVAGGYLAINFAIGNGIEPIFLGKQFGMATSMVLISVLVWGWIWGPAGMLLAVPITLFVKLALKNSSDLRWIAEMIDDADEERLTADTQNVSE